MPQKIKIGPPSVPRRKLRRVRSMSIYHDWVWIDRYQSKKHFDKGFEGFFSGRMKAKSKLQRFAMLFIGLWFIMPIPVGLLEYLLSRQSVFQREPISICILLPFTLIGFFCLLNYVNNLDDDELS